jgi:hypothetical protein
MTPLTKQLLIAAGITAVVAYITDYIVMTMFFPPPSVEYASLGDPMPASGLLKVTVILMFIVLLICTISYLHNKWNPEEAK